MSFKPPKVVIPGLNRGAGVPPGYMLGRLPGTGHGPAQLLNLGALRKIGIAAAAGVVQSTSLAISTATSLVASLSGGVSGSISSVVSQVTSLSTAVSSVDSGQSTSLSQVSSSLSGAISSTSSLSTAVSTVISGSISVVNSRIDSLSAAGGGGATTFLALTDTPASYAGAAGKVTAVNVGETALEFITAVGVGTVTTSGVPASGNLTKFTGATVITNGDLSGDVTTSGTLTVTIANDAVTFAKMQDSSAASKLLGRGSASGAGNFEEITLGTNLTMSGTTLNASGGSGTPPPPQGRLTLVSATPVMISDQTAKTTVYYAEYAGNIVPLYDGANMVSYTFNNLSAILDTTNHKLENLYDVFAYLDTTAKIGFSPTWLNTATVTWTSASPGVCTWTNHGLYEGCPVIFTAGTSTPTGITAGTTYYVSKTGLAASAFSVSTSVANAAAGTNVNTSSTGVGTQTGTNHTTVRGTGAGTAELELKNGLWTNKNAITLYNNSVASSSISANQATYLGTIYCTANGQTGMAFRATGGAGGSAPILGVYNAYNRIHTSSLELDTTASWTYASTTWRASNGSVSNRITFIDGLAQSFVDTKFDQSTSTTATSAGLTGISLNTTANAPATNGQAGNAANSANATLCCSENFMPALGVRFVQAMEASVTGTVTYQAANTVSRQCYALRVWLDM